MSSDFNPKTMTKKEAELAKKDHQKIIDEFQSDKMSHYSKELHIKILYTNHKHELSWRTISPIRIFFGETQFYKGEQWFMKAFDTVKEVERDFALANIKSTQMN